MTGDVTLDDVGIEPEHPERVEELLGQIDGMEEAMALVLDRVAVLEMDIDELWNEVHARR